MKFRSHYEFSTYAPYRLLYVYDEYTRQKEIIGDHSMLRFYKLYNQIVITKTDYPVGEELHPNTSEGKGEQHLPVISLNKNVTVNVGAVDHPMLEAHCIQWIVLETANGYQKHDLKPGEKPEARFAITEPVIAAYEYCNLHGLWMAEA